MVLLVLAVLLVLVVLLVIFDNDGKVTKYSERKRMFCGLVIIIKNFNFINSRSWLPNSISHLFHPGLFSSWPLRFYTRGVLVEISLLFIENYMCQMYSA